MFGPNRLPGIAFQTVLPPPPEALPRMDIALFVGFAERGPVHRAIPIDDVAGYRRVFGGDLRLARDPESGGTLTAALAPSVRAFFSNGGVRCWVIRVARTAALDARWGGTAHRSKRDLASAGAFVLPGLLALAADGTLRLAGARARSLGSWSDRLTVGARSERMPVAVCDFSCPNARARFTASRPIAVGTLLEITDAAGLLYATVDAADGRTISAACLKRFTPVADAGPAEPVVVHRLGGSDSHAAQFEEGRRRLTFLLRPAEILPATWLIVTRSSGDVIFLVE